jgi:hypothetical protein
MWNDTDSPLAYLISFRTRGTWLHGDERGAIDRFHNQYRSPYIPAIPRWHQYNREKLMLVALKANATRQLRTDGLWTYGFSPWARKGSKRNLWTERSVARVVEYVLHGQGDDLPEFDD